MNIGVHGWNVIRPQGRERLGLSAGILGNGFALSAASLARVPYVAHSIVEDAEHHLALVNAGMRVGFVDEATVTGAFAASGQAGRTQRARWEGGRLQLLRSHLPRAIAGAMTGRWQLLDPVLDMMLLPLAWLVMLQCLALAGAPWAQAVGLAGLAIVAAHVLRAAYVSTGSWRGLRPLMGVPAYLAWKLAMLPAILASASHRASWARTPRRASELEKLS